MNGLTLYV